MRDAVIRNGVIDQTAEERNVATGADLQEKVGVRRRPREARIDNDHLCVPLKLGFNRPFEPHGWFSAGLPPMINIMSLFLMSIQPFVIAPRPNVGPKLETVGPCQTRAWFSR